MPLRDEVVESAIKIAVPGAALPRAARALRRFAYDGLAMIREYDAAGNVLASFVHGPGADEPVVLYEGGTKRFYHADHQGSVIALADAAGNLAAINRYDEYGVPQTGNIGAFSTPAKPGCRRSGSIITRRTCTHRSWGASYRPTRSGAKPA